jgi:hypothetical protein
MKAQWIITVMVTSIACLFTGCASLQSPFVVGEPVSFKEHSVDEVLVLKLAGAPYILQLVDDTTFRVETVQWSEEMDAFTPVTGELIVSQLGRDIRFLNFRLKGARRYTVLRLSHEEGDLGRTNFQAVAYTIDEERIKRLVRSGQVQKTGRQSEREGPVFYVVGSKEDVDRFFLRHNRELFGSHSGLAIIQAEEEEAVAFVKQHEKDITRLAGSGMSLARLERP